MKTKIIILTAGLLIALAFFSFKPKKIDSNSKVILVSLMNGKGDNEGFIITTGDGIIEKRPFKVKMLDQDNWIEIQSKTAVIMNEMKERGYHYSGTHQAMLNFMIFEKD